jgi:hypothetical protein
LLLTIQLLHAQHVEGFLSLNHLQYHDNQQGHYLSDISPNAGYSFGIGWDSLGRSGVRIEVQFDHIGGHVVASNGGLGSGYGVELDFTKSSLTGLLYPLTVRLAQTAGISFGLWMSVLIHESYQGEYHTWSMGPPVYEDVNAVYTSFNSKVGMGLSSRLSFDVPVSPSVSLTPHLSFRLGLAREFVRVPELEKKMEFHFGIGIRKNFGSNDPAGSRQ